MTARLTTRVCIVCGGSGGTSALKGLLTRCPDCSFGWTTAELPKPEDLYDRSYLEGAGYEHYYQHDARQFESRLRLKWLLCSGPVSRLVEAGAAGGFFVAAARAAGIDARGIEMSEFAASYAVGTLGVPVSAGAFESAVIEPPVGVVCAWHVLEHVDSPAEFLAAAHRALEPGGRIALEVPNISGAAAGRLGSAWPSIEPRFHRWHFTPGSLGRLLTDNGFTITAQDTVFSRFYWQPRARFRHLRELLIADWVASGSPRISHPTKGDLLRVVAVRRPGPAGTGPTGPEQAGGRR